MTPRTPLRAPSRAQLLAERAFATFERFIHIEAVSGVVLLLNHAISGNELLELVEQQLGEAKPAEPTTYSTVGAGSQILRDLGVRKMRLLSSPVKFNAISGFDLEVVEYVTCE